MQLSRKTERIIAIDLLRGYFLFVIIIDHLGRFPGLFDLATGRGALWVSAAEGFFFVSGMMVGLVRGRNMLGLPISEVGKKLLGRGLKLYLWAVGLTILFSLVGFAVMSNPHLKSGLTDDRNIWHLIWQSATLYYAYGWSDFLQHYAIYLTLSPLAIWLLRKKLWPVVAAGSFLVWLLRGNNIYAAWQILFFAGTIIGFYLQDIEHFCRRLAPRKRRFILGVLLAASAITLTASIVIIHGRSFTSFAPYRATLEQLHAITQPYFLRASMNWPRLSLFALWFATAYSLVRLNEAWLMDKAGSFFVPLGQNSLYVYIVQAIVIFFLDLITPPNSPFIINVITNISVVVIIWYAVRKRFLFNLIPR